MNGKDRRHKFLCLSVFFASNEPNDAFAEYLANAANSE